MLGYLIKLQDSREPHSAIYQIPDLAKEQANWWLLNLKAAQVESSILDPREQHQMDPIEIYTDAAGGDELSLKMEQGGFAPLIAGSMFHGLS